MRTVIYVLLAVLVPIVWGVASAWAFDRWRARCKTDTASESMVEQKERAS